MIHVVGEGEGEGDCILNCIPYLVFCGLTLLLACISCLHTIEFLSACFFLSQSHPQVLWSLYIFSSFSLLVAYCVNNLVSILIKAALKSVQFIPYHCEWKHFCHGARIRIFPHVSTVRCMTYWEADRHDTFYTPVLGLVSLAPTNSIVQSAIWVVMAQVLTVRSLLRFKFLLLARGECHWWHYIYWYPYLHHHVIQISAQNTASVLHVMLDELWPSISLLQLLLCLFALPPAWPPKLYTKGKCTWQCVILYGKHVCMVGKLAFIDRLAYH